MGYYSFHNSEYLGEINERYFSISSSIQKEHLVSKNMSRGWGNGEEREGKIVCEQMLI